MIIPLLSLLLLLVLLATLLIMGVDEDPSMRA